MTPRAPSCCPEFASTLPHRRQVLQIGVLGAFGLSLSGFFQAQVSASPRQSSSQPRARSCILLHQFGGPSHLDSFDPKPDAATGIRGPFNPIATAVPGVCFSEHLPRLARSFSRFALVRSVTHRTSAHNSAAYYSLTGHRPLIDIVTANASAVDVPAYGSVVSYLQGPPPGRQVPPFVSLPTMIADGPFRTPGEFGGFLGRVHDPLFVLSDPNSPSFNVSELTLPDGIGMERASDRDLMLQELDALSRLAESPAVRSLSGHRARALALLTSRETQQALDIHREPAATRDRYGRTTYGQSVLLARRLVEAGVRFVTVYYSAGIGGWDTHRDNFTTLQTSRLPNTDVAVSALLEDLHQRGLLNETLVIWMGEFGRTPRINADAGRDHWPQCYTVLMAGGGIPGGMVYGSSDRSGAFPHENPVPPDDLAATLFTALGLDPETEVRDQLGRPFPISRGQAIQSFVRSS